MSLRLGIGFLLSTLFLFSCSGGSSNKAKKEVVSLDQLNCTNGISGNPNGIIGGDCVQAGDDLQKRVAAIYFEDEDGKVSICTASIMSSKTLLTAGHCVPEDRKTILVVFHENATRTVSSLLVSLNFRSLNATALRQIVDKVRTADFDKTSFPMVRAAKYSVVHHNYYASSSVVENDLALISLNEDIPATHLATPILTNEDYRNLFFNDEIRYFAAGYGVINNAGNGTGYLRKTEAKRVFSKSYENSKLEKVDYRFDSADLVIDQRSIDGKNKGICKGDSGGGLFASVRDRIYITGVASSVQNTSEEEMCYGFGNYMNSIYYSKWIEDNQKHLSKY